MSCSSRNPTAPTPQFLPRVKLAGEGVDCYWLSDWLRYPGQSHTWRREATGGERGRAGHQSEVHQDISHSADSQVLQVSQSHTGSSQQFKLGNLKIFIHKKDVFFFCVVETLKILKYWKSSRGKRWTLHTWPGQKKITNWFARHDKFPSSFLFIELLRKTYFLIIGVECRPDNLIWLINDGDWW